VSGDGCPDDWQDAAWRREVRAWLVGRLGTLGVEETGPVEQPHAPWWSTVLRVPTTAGTLWFKAARDGGVEARLTALLNEVEPECTVELLATEPDRGWMLTRDAGERLREHATGTDQLRCWEELLPRYAALQVRLTGRVDEVLALGVPDLRPAVLSRGARVLAEDDEMLRTAPEDALTEAELSELREHGLPELDRLCAELAARGIPDTLQHDDLHDGNTFVRDRAYVFFDWGDACVSHPFHTLVVTLRALAYRLGLEPGSPQLIRLRDAYLEPWDRFGTRAELVETAELARRTGTVQRALAWYATVLAMPPERRHEEQDSVPYGVRLFLRDAGWGAWS
jgi:hypothetical protein